MDKKKDKKKFLLGFIIGGLIFGGLLFSMIGVSAASIASTMATYSDVKSKENVSTVQEAIDELYHTIGPIYEIYNNDRYELTRTLPNSNTAELYNNITSIIMMLQANYTAAYASKEEKNKLINFLGSEHCTENASNVYCRIPEQSLYCSLDNYSFSCGVGDDCRSTWSEGMVVHNISPFQHIRVMKTSFFQRSFFTFKT